MVFVQKQPVFPLFFQAIQARKMSFTIFYNEKTPFQAIETKNSKSRIIDIFPKGLTNGFGPKNGHFSKLFFQAKQVRKMFFTIFYNEKTLFYAIKTKNSKSRIIDIFPQGLIEPMVLVQKWPFFQTFFLGKIGQEIVFYDILQRKNSFLGYKNRKFKKSKN